MWLVRLFTATTSWYDDCINLLQTHRASFALVRWHRHLFFFCFVFCTLATAESMLDMRVGSLCTLAWVELYRHLLFFPFSPFAWFYIFFRGTLLPSRFICEIWRYGLNMNGWWFRRRFSVTKTVYVFSSLRSLSSVVHSPCATAQTRIHIKYCNFDSLLKFDVSSAYYSLAHSTRRRRVWQLQHQQFMHTYTCLMEKLCLLLSLINTNALHEPPECKKHEPWHGIVAIHSNAQKESSCCACKTV